MIRTTQLALATAAILASPRLLASPAPIQDIAVLEMAGSVTYAEPTIPITAFQIGSAAAITIKPDLGTPPTAEGPNGLRYSSSPSANRALLGDEYVLASGSQLVANLVIQNGQGGLPDTLVLTQDVSFHDDSVLRTGTAEFRIVIPDGDAWSSPDITTLPTSLVLDASAGELATLTLHDLQGLLLAEVSLDGFFLDATGEQGCTAVPNSTGRAGRLVGVGSRAVSDNDFRIQATNLPTGSFGLFIV